MTTYDLEILIRTKKQGTGASDAAKDVDNLGKQLNGTLETLNKSAVAAAAAGATFKKAFELGKQGAALNQLTESFDRMNEQVFHMPGLLEEMSEAVRGTVKETDLMQGVMKLTSGASEEMAQSMAAAAPKLLEIAKAAIKLDPTLGSTAFVFQSLATGIKRASPLMIDNANISVKIGEANEQLALSLGKTVDQLTVEEKQTALLNETMRAGDQLIQQVGGNVDSQADSWAQLETQVGSLVDTILGGFAKRAGPAIGGFAGFIDKLGERQEQLNEAVDAGVISQAEANNIIAGSILGLDHYKEAMRAAIKLVDDMKIGTDRWQHSAGLTAEQIEELNAATEELTQGEKNHLAYQLLVNEATESGIDPVNAYANAVEVAADARARGDETIRLQDEERAAAEERLAEAIKQRAEADALGAEIVRNHNAQMGDYFTAALNATEETSLFGVATEDLGTKFVTVGGLTGAQREDLDRLRSAYERSERKLRDYEIGLDGAGLSSGELNDKMQEQREEMERLNGAMAPLLAVTGDVVAVNNEAQFSSEAIASALYDAADAAGAGIETMVGLAKNTGLYDEAALKASLQQGLMEEAIVTVGGALANNDITLEEAITKLGNYQSALEEGKTAAFNLGDETDKTKGHSKKLKEDGLGLVANFLEGTFAEAMVVGQEQQRELAAASIEAWGELDTLAASALAAATQIANIPDNKTITITYNTVGKPPGFAGGVRDFIVPPGFPNDSFPVMVESGERVNVTPAGQSSPSSGRSGPLYGAGGGSNINVSVAPDYNSRRSPYMAGRQVATGILDALGDLN